jgi:serine/threonine-protein kinase HipA
MAIRGDKSAHYRLRDIQMRHWQRLAAACGPGVRERMLRMVRAVDGALETVAQSLPHGFPARTWEPIAAGMRRHAAQFLRRGWC